MKYLSFNCSSYYTIYRRCSCVYHYKATYTQPIFYIGYALKAKIFRAGEKFASKNFIALLAILLFPFFGNRVCFTIFGNYIRHHSRLKATDILNHQDRFATMMNKVVLKVITEI